MEEKMKPVRGSFTCNKMKAVRMNHHTLCHLECTPHCTDQDAHPRFRIPFTATYSGFKPQEAPWIHLSAFCFVHRNDIKVILVKIHLYRCCITLRRYLAVWSRQRQQPRLHCSNGTDRHSFPLTALSKLYKELAQHNRWKGEVRRWALNTPAAEAGEEKQEPARHTRARTAALDWTRRPSLNTHERTGGIKACSTLPDKREDGTNPARVTEASIRAKR